MTCSFLAFDFFSIKPIDRVDSPTFSGPQGLAMLQVDSDSPSTSSPHMSLSRVYENELYDDISPRLSNHFRSIALMERTPSDKSPLHYFMEASRCSSTTTTPSPGTLISKSTAEMIKEISMLEVEIIHLERYLLSLYRTSFENHLATLSSTCMDQDSRSYSQCKTESPLQELIGHSSCREARDNVSMQRSGRVQHNPAASTCGRTNNLISPPPTKGKSKRGSGLHRLADHLGGSLLDQIAETPDKLSEEIVRCMTAIYCNLASSRLPDIGVSVSSSPSLSSSNTLSPQDLHDNWSPLCSEETTEYPCQPEGLKENNGPYAKMVEISKISLDDERLNYVASMLQNFRSLVRHLEKIDPRKMNREEKLTFWVNIHNALVMHAYLAYGIHHNRIRSTSLVLKAAYNVGGHSISAHVIQSSILGCRPRRSASWLPAVFKPGTRSSGGSRHTYALDYQEPLVYFSLCSGAYSDPAVRVYTATNIFEALRIAKQEFIRARVVSICKEGTNKKLILLPRILHYFAKDASLNLYGLLEMVHACQSEAQWKVLEGCLNGGKPDKYIEWLPYNSAFRYVINP